MSEETRMKDVNQQIREYIDANLFVEGGHAALKDEDSFLEKGIIDSTGVLELVNWMETTFGFEVGDEELVPENLDSIRRLAGFIARKSVKV
jgi:acyl carrier protein